MPQPPLPHGRPQPPPGSRPRAGNRGARRGTARRGPRRWAARTVVALSVSVLAAAGVGHAVLSGLGSGIGRVDPFHDMKNRPAAGHGMNVLLVGTDGRDKISAADKQRFRLGGAPCHCTDTIMIVHLSAGRDRASVVSLPRDSYARLPRHRDSATGKIRAEHPVKLNAAYAEGGPQLTVRTVEDMTGIKIDHYLEVDFTSFIKTVDVLDGVRICTVRPLKDRYSGLDLSAGSHVLGGGEALQYVRSRHVDGASDLSRMQRQQRFLAALVDKATSSGVLLNPVRFRALANAVLGSVRADTGFDTDEMLDLGQTMRGFSPSSSEFVTVPVDSSPAPVKGLGATVRWDEPKARALFRSVREDRPLAPHRTAPASGARPAVVDVPPAQIRVQVENAAGRAGLGSRIDRALHATGFATTGAPRDAAEHDARRTVIAYDPRWDRSAHSLHTALPGSELRAVKGQGPVLKVLAGGDSPEVRPVRAEEPSSPTGTVVTGDDVACPEK